MEALCDEAEAVARTGAPKMVVIDSTAPPALSQTQKSASAATRESSDYSAAGSLSVLQSRPTAPIAILQKHRSRDYTNSRDTLNHISTTSTLTPASMADIAAAIEQVAKAPPSTDNLPHQTSLDDHVRQQMIGEISQAVRTVLATELPKMVRHAVSASLYELVTTNYPASEADAIIGQPSRKSNRKKTTAKKATAKKATAKKSVSKKGTPK